MTRVWGSLALGRTLAPSTRRTSPITWTSEMQGTLSRRTSPAAITEAAMSLSAEFLAPPIVTSPLMGLPPRTTMS